MMFPKPKRKPKYGAKRTSRGDLGFASKLEASLYDLLILREKAGEINQIRSQPRVLLSDAKISWKVDFSAHHIPTNQTLYFEAKGVSTADFRIKLKLWRFYGPGPLELWKGNYQKPELVEIIFPHNP